MSEPRPAPRVTATNAAVEAIARMQAERGPLMFVQSGGCCDGSLPMCFQAGEFVIGDNDLLLGMVGGCPFYIESRLDTAWGQPQLVLDIAAGEPEGFSLPAASAGHFITRSTACTHASAPTA